MSAITAPAPAPAPAPKLAAAERDAEKKGRSRTRKPSRPGRVPYLFGADASSSPCSASSRTRRPAVTVAGIFAPTSGIQARHMVQRRTGRLQQRASFYVIVAALITLGLLFYVARRLNSGSGPHAGAIEMFLTA